METLKYTKMLEKAGFTRNQSETHIQILSKVIGGNLVTKQDLINTEYKIDARFCKVETRIDTLESNIKHEMEKLQNQLIVKLGFMMFSLFGGAVAVGGLLLAYLN